ncbi:MAG: hypothetical protein RIB84_29995 [Sneathiellaceae bacterium]
MDSTQIAILAAMVGALILAIGGVGWSRLRGATIVSYIATWLGIAVLIALAYRLFNG